MEKGTSHLLGGAWPLMARKPRGGYRALVIMTIIMLSIIQNGKSQFNFSLACTSTQYAQWSAFLCKDCGTNQIAVQNNSNCACVSGSIITGAITSTAYNCATCPAGQKANILENTCVTSATCSSGQIYNKMSVAGVQSTNITCTSCSANAYPWSFTGADDKLFCQHCGPNYTRPSGVACTCPQTLLNDSCVVTTTWTTLTNTYAKLGGTAYKSITYSDPESEDNSTFTVSSYAMTCFYEQAVNFPPNKKIGLHVSAGKIDAELPSTSESLRTGLVQRNPDGLRAFQRSHGKKCISHRCNRP
jgi:hypothetical protein